MILNIFLTLFLVFLNGFFVAAEFAIVKVRSSQIDLMVKTGSKPALMAKKILGRLDAYLSATQLGITLASLGLGFIGERVVAQIVLNIFDLLGLNLDAGMAHRIALPSSFVLITILHIVFGELAPKSLAIQRSESTTLAVAYPLNAFYMISWPFIWFLNGMANVVIRAIGIEPAAEQEVHSPEELRYLVDQGGESGSLAKANYEIIRNAFDFSTIRARQIMVPRTQISALNIDHSDRPELERILDEGYSRVPVYKGTIDNIVGILYTKDLLLEMRKNPEVNVKNLLRKAYFIPESKKISDVLKDFQKQHTHMAVVVNEYGGTEGIIALEDIVEELVGEIQDEYDVEVPIVTEVSPGNFSAIASAAVADINDYLPDPLPLSEEYDTLAGLLINQIGRIPNSNEKIALENYEATVLKKTRNNINLVQLRFKANGSEPLARPAGKE
jgi:CBS domain containing-hemolysin-like protein